VTSSEQKLLKLHADYDRISPKKSKNFLIPFAQTALKPQLIILILLPRQGYRRSFFTVYFQVYAYPQGPTVLSISILLLSVLQRLFQGLLL